MNNVTVGIKTFIRMQPLERALDSLIGQGFAEVIVADDSEMSSARRALYAKYAQRLPLKVIELPFHSGISYGRNRMVEACTTPYFLLMDDDHFLAPDILPLLDILESDPSLGAVTAQTIYKGRHYASAGNLYRFGDTLVRDIGCGEHRKVRLSSGGYRYFVYEFISNFALFRTETFRDVKWDEVFVANREHMDFYLEHQRLGKWRFAISPDCTFGHNSHDSADTGDFYRTFRNDEDTLQIMIRCFKEKWGLKRDAIWGLAHFERGRGIKARAIHFLVCLARLFRRRP